MKPLKGFLLLITSTLIFYVALRLLLIDCVELTVRDEYFGHGAIAIDDKAIRPFSLSVTEDELEELRDRLRKTIFADPVEEVNDFQDGVNPAFLKFFRDNWLHEYDWREEESMLNELDHYTTEIEGLRIHFIHQKPPRKKYNLTYPLVLIHGWPGSAMDFRKVVRMLTDPIGHGLQSGNSMAFEVVAPTIPGCGWSSPPKKQGFGMIAAARVFAKLLERLQIPRYLCHGSDSGFLVATSIAQMYPERVQGLHLSTAYVNVLLHPTQWIVYLINAFKETLLSEEDNSNTIFSTFRTTLQETGFINIQATKPDTIGVLLRDSPIGLAAYMLEKYSTWTNVSNRLLRDGGLFQNFDMTDLITQVMIYWLPGCIGSSMRIYKETIGQYDSFIYFATAVKSPTGITRFPNDPIRSPLSHLKCKYVNIVRSTKMARGGHFAALEEPKLCETVEERETNLHSEHSSDEELQQNDQRIDSNQGYAHYYLNRLDKVPNRTGARKAEVFVVADETELTQEPFPVENS
uniref:microsomal epoxide hydrolase n=1 Tax=Trichuris muris TaxID=70415 RepID=A0A5S6Q3W8_TRIMR